VRTLSGVVLTAVFLAGCHGGSRMPGAPFAGASLLAPLSGAEEAHDALLRADLGRTDSVAALGFAPGLATVFTLDVVYLRGGLPIVRGRGAVQAIVAAESLGASTTVRWQPVRAEASSDGRSGYSYGYAVYGVPSPTALAPSIRLDRYIAFWRRESDGWKIAAYAETYGAPPAALALPRAAVDSALADVSMQRARGPLDDIRVADIEFSRTAMRLGTGRAFEEYAADDAQIFSTPGEFITGPEAIREAFGPTNDASQLTWHPVVGEVARSGDLGYTAGNAVFTGKRPDGVAEVRYSKYLTVWRKQRDGSWRYVVDGGNARPND
jgi:ketosteroid isomerase-like protein